MNGRGFDLSIGEGGAALSVSGVAPAGAHGQGLVIDRAPRPVPLTGETFMKTRIALMAAVAALATAALTPAAHAQDASVKVEFELGRSTGSVMLVLFASEADYNTNRPVRNAVIPADATTVSVTFEGLEPGSYAIKSFHDINGNGDMDTNPFGMPIEPYAFSNNALGNMGPASWSEARFTVEGDTVQTLILR